MRMLVSVEFADAGTKSGTHRVLIIGRGPESPAAGATVKLLPFCTICWVRIQGSAMYQSGRQP